MVECPTENPGAILTRVRIFGAARDFFPQSQISVQTVLRCPYVHGVQSRASTSVCTLKIPSTDNGVPLSGHTKILHTLISNG